MSSLQRLAAITDTNASLIVQLRELQGLRERSINLLRTNRDMRAACAIESRQQLFTVYCSLFD